ncbi:MAG: hypothetical protein WDN49_19245 [Acetobacteraceae bacterium]
MIRSIVWSSMIRASLTMPSVLRGLRRRTVRLLEGEAHGLGGESFAVLELDALPQVKTPGDRVKPFPALSQAGNDLERRVEADQRVIDVFEEDTMIGRDILGTVERLQIDRHGQGYRAKTGGRAGPSAQQRCPGSGEPRGHGPSADATRHHNSFTCMHDCGVASPPAAGSIAAYRCGDRVSRKAESVKAAFHGF